ncbi:MAG TPA: hypothetical protein VH108_03825 [Gaiellaceae bacterium]|jgi:hypothetical protein|nr:hypothetical protein [Gaiellaceae bacterium]
MKRALLVACIVLAFAGAAAASGGDPSATGGSQLTVHDVFGLQTLELQSFGFTARSTHDGLAEGWFNYHEVDDGALFTANGPVTCLTVIGNDAWIGAVIQRSNDPTYVGLGAWWHVTDNGEGTARDVTTFLGVGSLEATQAFCDTHPAYRHPFPIDSGNIQVRG